MAKRKEFLEGNRLFSKLNLHESCVVGELNNQWEVTKVKGGWIYKILDYNTAVFVPDTLQIEGTVYKGGE